MVCRTILLTYKHKTQAVDSDGKISSNADVDFYVDDVSCNSGCSVVLLSYAHTLTHPCLLHLKLRKNG